VIDGVKLTLGGRDFTVPPLSLKSVRKLAPKLRAITSMGDIPTDEEMDTVVEVVHSAIVRNYQEITAEEVEGFLDLGNLKDVLLAVLGVSGFVQGKEQVTASSTGSVSTA